LSYLCNVNQTKQRLDNEKINIVLINQTLGVMSKKNVIILGSVVVVCGLFGSLFVDWPVDFSSASGDIAKATRFSREQASEKLTNMEELLQTDSAFKETIVVSQVVMQTRAAQFGTLVDMSNEVAGNIPAFAEVLKEMNASREMVNNVSTSLAESGEKLNAALSGEESPELAQSTINASLAYTTLQKQNKLATRFIETTDKYLETAKADDQLKFVRDQWLEYQQMTAALEGDKASAEALAKKGNLLSGEKALAAVSKCDLNAKMTVLQSCELALSMNVPSGLASAINPETLGHVVSAIRSAAEVTMVNMTAEGALQNNQVEKFFNNALDEAMKNTSADAIASMQKLGLDNVQKMASTQKEVLGLNKGGGPVVFGSAVKMVGSNSKVMEAYSTVVGNVARSLSQSQVQKLGLVGAQSIGSSIKETSLGNKPTLGARIPW
jgi:hypothetical protein